MMQSIHLNFANTKLRAVSPDLMLAKITRYTVRDIMLYSHFCAQDRQATL